MIQINYYSPFREITKRTSSEIEYKPKLQLHHLLENLSEECGEDFRHPVEQDSAFNVLINGQNYHVLGGLHADLKGNDQISLLAIMVGGYLSISG